MLHEYLMYMEQIYHIGTFMYFVFKHLSMEFWIKQVFPKENMLSLQFNIHLYKGNEFGNLNGNDFSTNIINIMSLIRIQVAELVILVRGAV